MKNILLFVLLCIGITFAFNNELRSYVITDSAVAEYKKMPKIADSVEIFKILDEKKYQYYMDREAMNRDLEEALADYPKIHRIVNNNSYASKAVSKKLMAAVPPEDSIVDYVWLNSSDMDSLKSYILKDLWHTSYSPTIATFLDSIKDIVFADSKMMRDYAVSLFAAFLGVCYDTTRTYQKIKSAIWNNDDVADLFRRVYEGKNDAKIIKNCIEDEMTLNPFDIRDKPKSQLERDCWFNQMLNRRYKYLYCSEDRWHQALQMVDSLYAHLLKNIVDSLSQNEARFSDNVPVVWAAKDCGCSQYKDLNGNVYAIYPYWLAKEGGDTLDFSVITRIAYYGIYADDMGNLRLPSGSDALDFFDKPKYSNFVNVAHKYNVKVDWIISKNDWDGLANDSTEMLKFLDTLIFKIDNLVSKKNNSLARRFVSQFTIDGRDKGFRGDGVTLWFKNFPTDPKNTEIFRNEFKKLQKLLRKTNEFAFVNLMMDLSDLEEKMNERKDSVYDPMAKGIYSYEFFRSLLNRADRIENHKKGYTARELDEELRNFLIVLNNEPVSRNKLVLYNDLNQQMSGPGRTEVLHAVVPMLWLDYKQWQELEDDASFYNDAFYSLGIAPYGLMENSLQLEDKLSQTILKNFEKEDGLHKTQGPIASFFCTNRWIFRMLNTLVYVFVFLLLLCYILICRVNAFFTKRLALFVAIVAVPPLLTTLILSNFDPSFMDFVGNVGRWGCFFVIVLTVIAITLLQVYRSTDVPKRLKK